MTDTSQKLREAFETYITDDGKWPNAILKAPGGQYLLLRTSVAWQDWKACDEALALPTAAPVGELPELPEAYGYFDIRGSAADGYTADQMRAYARAALRAGDAVDAQRYRWLKGRSQVCLNQVWIGGYTTRQRDSDFLSKEDALSAIDAAIDAAMRKGQI